MIWQIYGQTFEKTNAIGQNRFDKSLKIRNLQEKEGVMTAKELKEKIIEEMGRLEDYADEHWDVELCKGATRFSDMLYDFIRKLEV